MKKKNIKKSRLGITSSIAVCNCCDWRYEGEGAMKQARTHCIETTHSTSIEQAIATHFTFIQDLDDLLS